MGQEHWTTSAWLEGCEAARAGKKMENNPYPIKDYGFSWNRSWTNGWMFGNTSMRQEQLTRRKDDETN